MTTTTGLRSPEPLKKGEFIDLYLGEVIGSEEAESRANEGNREGLSYLFDLDKFSDLGDEGSTDELSRDHEDGNSTYTIDGRKYGAVTRFINHSCDPNLNTYAVASDRRDGEIYDLALFTNRAVPAYEELSFSYVAHTPSAVPPKDDQETWPCYCESENCVKRLWN